MAAPLCVLPAPQVEVAMDEPFPGGATLQGGKEKCGFTCSALELQQVGGGRGRVQGRGAEACALHAGSGAAGPWPAHLSAQSRA